LRGGGLGQRGGRHSANGKQRQKKIAHHRPLEGGLRQLPTRYAASRGPSMQKRPIREAVGSSMPSASPLTRRRIAGKFYLRPPRKSKRSCGSRRRP
jgi:hypothetical protein